MTELERELRRVLERHVHELLERALRAIHLDEERQLRMGAASGASRSCVFVARVSGYELMLHYDRKCPARLVLLQGGRIADRSN
jgi:hypothetical protein